MLLEFVFFFINSFDIDLGSSGGGSLLDYSKFEWFIAPLVAFDQGKRIVGVW